jgi:predicted histidine transporter YuiF (NhaC family)
VAEKYSAEIIAIEIMPDHVHVLVEVGIRILVASGYVETLNDCGQCVSLAKASNAG